MRLSDRQGEFLIRILRVWKGSYFGNGALACLGLAGLVLSPNFIWVLASWWTGTPLNDALAKSGLTPVHWVFAAALVACAMVLLLAMYWQGHRPEKSAVIAVRHQSFDGNTHPLTEADLPDDHRGCLVLGMEIDQTEFAQNGKMIDPAAALKKQLSLAGQLKMHLSTVKDATLVYYGKAHIPLAFAAGYSAQSDTPLRLYELDRDNGGWRRIDEVARGEDLKVTVKECGELKKGGIAIIRISISYLVGEAEVDERLGEVYADYHLQIATPKIDVVTSRRQVEEIAGKFRELVDRLRNSAEAPREIHVFCAAPMCVVFSLGRRVSPTLHPAIFVHNYNATSTPKYALGGPDHRGCRAACDRSGTSNCITKGKHVSNVHDELNKFYRDFVRLGRDRRKILGDFRDNCLIRLNTGLDRLGERNRRQYAYPLDTRDQGGYAMHTLNQARGNEYDIDVALIFRKEDLPDEAADARYRVRDAFALTAGQFKDPPNARQNAVTFWYASGEHVDFAIYRAYRDAFGRDILEHAGGDRWSERDPERVTKWFNDMVDAKSPSVFTGATVEAGQLRRIVRFIKFFCRSREDWRLPGGMITTVLVVECYKPHNTRDDLSLLRTVEALWWRLMGLTSVTSPVDGSNLTEKPKRLVEVLSLRDRLAQQLESLRVIDEPRCTVARARAAWRQFFNHEFWNAENAQPRKSLLAPATAASTPFAFPSMPRVPSKPQGFA